MPELDTTEMKRQAIIEATGEDPEDMFGPDWEDMVDQYSGDEAFCSGRGKGCDHEEYFCGCPGSEWDE